MFTLPQKPELPELILHICCAGCGVYTSKLLAEAYRVVMFFYNPNIFPADEYERRLAETAAVSTGHRLPLIVGDYDHAAWLKKIAGHEKDKERGERCVICYRYRLEAAALEAKRRGAGFFTTTLTTSPHKNATVINEIGLDIAKKHDVVFLPRDFKKADGFKKSILLGKKLSLYRQNYCGCEFSIY